MVIKSRPKVQQRGGSAIRWGQGENPEWRRPKVSTKIGAPPVVCMNANAFDPLVFLLLFSPNLPLFPLCSLFNISIHPCFFPFGISQSTSSSFFTGHFSQFYTSDKIKSSVLFRRGTYFSKVAIFCKSNAGEKHVVPVLPRKNISESRGSGLASVKIASYSRLESLFQYSLHRFFPSVCTGTSCKFTGYHDARSKNAINPVTSTVTFRFCPCRALGSMHFRFLPDSLKQPPRVFPRSPFIEYQNNSRIERLAVDPR